MQTVPVPYNHIQTAVRTALEEDLGTGDVTTNALFLSPLPARATIIAHEDLTIGGLTIAQQVFAEIDPQVGIDETRHDGEAVQASTVLLTVTGDAKSLLQGERIALNFLQHLSGIATLTREFCQAVQGYSTKILDTRKTIPGLRALEKWAVRLGGGSNHRHTLSEGILIKDNHLSLLRAQGIDLDEACRLARAHGPHNLRICIEVRSVEEAQKALRGNPDIVLLDNMTPDMVKKTVDLIKGRALVEISGGITLANVQQVAAAGADFISIGALTHSATAMDISMDMAPFPKARSHNRK